jgi:hypothetical protein
MYLLEYALYMYERQFEMIPLGLCLALKLGLYPVAIAHLSPGNISLLVSKMPATGGFTEVGREYTIAIDFCPIFHRCIMDKSNHF